MNDDMRIRAAIIRYAIEQLRIKVMAPPCPLCPQRMIGEGHECRGLDVVMLFERGEAMMLSTVIPRLVPGSRYMSPDGLRFVTIVEAARTYAPHRRGADMVPVRNAHGLFELWARSSFEGWTLYDFDGYSAARERAHDEGWQWIDAQRAEP